MYFVWLQFAACAMLIAIAGTRLSRYGDIIADKTGLSGNWIGIILLASVTSLPELITGISSVALAGAPDIAVGNVLGSCMVNLSMLVVIDFLHRRDSFYRSVSRAHLLSAGFGVVLIGFVGMSVLLGAMTQTLAIRHVGFQTLVILLLYAIAIRAVLKKEQETIREFTEEVVDRYPGLGLHEAVVGYTFAAIVIIIAGVWLPFVGTQLVDAMGWHGSVVGTLFIAGATTLPELAVTISALRIGALDMAIGNLLGSNLFNIAILAVDDMFFLKGPLFSHVSSVHAYSAFSAIVMTGLVMIGITYRPRKRVLGSIGWISIGLLATYFLNAYVLFTWS